MVLESKSFDRVNIVIAQNSWEKIASEETPKGFVVSFFYWESVSHIILTIVLLELICFIIGRLFTRLHNSDENRLNQSWYYTTLREAALADLFTYQNFLRMTPTLFQTLAEKVAPHILRSDTKLRKSISVGNNIVVIMLTLHLKNHWQ